MSKAADPSSGLLARFQARRADFHLTVDLKVEAEILVLFGPSGSGKTTLLDAIVGLLTPDSGVIALHGRTLFDRPGPKVVVDVPARRRRIGYVLQQYALFPHLTAVQNAMFPLWRCRQARSRALRLLDRMSLAHLADRYPHQLSGGQQQRVAIARALAAEPQALLLDEPFGALDAAVRRHLQGDLAALQRELGLPVIYVTHSLEEAFAVGHRLAVLQDGRLQQVGTVEEVFRRPANHRVAQVMGLRNLFQAVVRQATVERLLLDWDGLLLELPPQAASLHARVTAYIRPEDVKILYPERPMVEAVRHNHTAGTLVASQFGPGGRTLQILLPNGHPLEVRHAPYAYSSLHLEAGQRVHLSLRKEALVLLGEVEPAAKKPAQPPGDRSGRKRG